VQSGCSLKSGNNVDSASDLDIEFAFFGWVCVDLLGLDLFRRNYFDPMGSTSV